MFLRMYLGANSFNAFVCGLVYWQQVNVKTNRLAIIRRRKNSYSLERFFIICIEAHKIIISDLGVNEKSRAQDSQLTTFPKPIKVVNTNAQIYNNWLFIDSSVYIFRMKMYAIARWICAVIGKTENIRFTWQFKNLRGVLRVLNMSHSKKSD